MKKLVLIVLLLNLALASTTAQANVTYNFHCITNNDTTGQAGAVGEAAFYVDVSDPGTFGPLDEAQVLFTFGVTPPDPDPFNGSYYIDGVYFYDGALLGIAAVLDAAYDPILYSGVNFDPNATPAHLPGFDPGDYPTLVNSFLATADADPGNGNGIHPGEWLGVLFNLHPNKTYDDVIAGMDSMGIIVGVKAQGFGEFSESFITPAPGAILLGSIGVGLVGWLRRRTL